MLKEILCFHQFYLEPHRKNDNENHDGDNDCILFSSVNSMCDNILAAVHTCSPFITQQKDEGHAILVFTFYRLGA